MTLTDATHATKGAHKTYHVVDDGRTVGTIDWLPTGEFVSYVDGTARRHANLQAALIRISRR
jgi:hypothetical protein